MVGTTLSSHEKSPHRPVLLAEAIDALAIQQGGFYADATFGGGGHSRAILQRLGDGGRLLALDRDSTAKKFVDGIGDSRLHFAHRNFADMADAAADFFGDDIRADGILMDLGASAMQLEDPLRGFSFRADGPPDMRMNSAEGESASAWLAGADESEIAQVLRELGEEPAARRIARAVVFARESGDKRLQSAVGLAEIICDGINARRLGHLRRGGARRAGIHPATRSFQAIRMRVNSELKSLAAGLAQARNLLVRGGRLVVISFHSLEDRIVKNFIRGESVALPGIGRLPSFSPLRPVGKIIRPTAEEASANPRVRSAKMRVAEKIGAGE